MPTLTARSKPDSLFLILMNLFLKKFISEPITTTGWILVGSSPKTTSIVIDKSNANIIKMNNSIESNLK